MQAAVHHAESASSVFVVDDDPSVRRAITRLLRAKGLRVEAFNSAAAFLAAAPKSDRACVLLDLQMPGTDGLSLQERMTDVGIGYPIVFVTGTGNVASSVRAMKAGAIDFLEKPFDGDDLLGAVERALDIHAERHQKQLRADELDRLLGRLTPRESEVMELVATGLRNRTVAERLGISERTVKVHRGRVMKKLSVRSIPDLARLLQMRRGAPLTHADASSRRSRLDPG
jgi:RNA polymerase sigma factor (sigma-70 family)